MPHTPYLGWACMPWVGRSYTVLKPVPGSGSRAKCAQFRGSSYAKHVSSWFQPWATLWPTCHMLVPASLLQSVDCSTECKNSIFHCTIGCNKYKSSLASGASPQTPPGGLFLPPGPPPPAWVHAAHRHGMVSPRKVWFQRPCSSLVLVPEEVVEPASGRYPIPTTSHFPGGARSGTVPVCLLLNLISSCMEEPGTFHLSRRKLCANVPGRSVGICMRA